MNSKAKFPAFTVTRSNRRRLVDQMADGGSIPRNASVGPVHIVVETFS